MPNIPEITKTVRVIHRISNDEKLRKLAEMLEKTLNVEATALGHAKYEGIDIGIDIGINIGIGIQQGIQQSIQEGWQEGKLEGWIQGWIEGWIQGWLEGSQETHDAFIEQMKLSGIPQETIDTIVERLK